MTMTIGICDDNPAQLDLMNAYLQSSNRAGNLKVFGSTDPAAFLDLVKVKQPQLVFLDIDMGEINGIDLGAEIKALDEDVVLIYVTAHEKYAVKAFSVRAFHYLLKPLTRASFEQVLDEGIKQVEKLAGKRGGSFVVKTKGEVARLKYGEIACFEKVGHRIRIRTAERDYFYYGNFTGLLAQLEEEFFVQCHQGYIANISKIRAFRDRTLFLNGGISLPVSRSYTDQVKRVLSVRLFD